MYVFQLLFILILLLIPAGICTPGTQKRYESVSLNYLTTPPLPSVPLVQYRDPNIAMVRRSREPVLMDINPAWNLTEEQANILHRLPRRVEQDGRVRFIYPEDEESITEALPDGTIFTTQQLRRIRRARRAARELAMWRARRAAEAYNRTHSATLAAKEKQGLHIIIRLSEQKGYLMDGNQRLRTFRICSGKSSTPTPTGHFHVLEKHREHRSNLYNDASMPFFMRLTFDGVGLHQGRLRSRPSSHGCIRLAWNDARYLFERCDIGTAVFVEN